MTSRQTCWHFRGYIPADRFNGSEGKFRRSEGKIEIFLSAGHEKYHSLTIHPSLLGVTRYNNRGEIGSKFVFPEDAGLLLVKACGINEQQSFCSLGIELEVKGWSDLPCRLKSPHVCHLFDLTKSDAESDF